MASGTQGYEAAQGDIIESLIDRFKKRKDDKKKKGDTSPPPNQPASISVSTPTQKMLVQGKTVQQLMPGSSALATTTGGDITQYSSENGEVLSVLVRETQTTNKLLQAQNQLLLRGSKGGAITKFEKQESALEETEDLSDTQGYDKAKQKNPFKALWDMIWGGIKNFLKPILEAVKALAPAIAAAAAIVVAAIKAQAIAQALGGLTQSLRGLRGGRIKPVTVRDVTGMPRGALTGTNVKGALPPGRVTPTSSALSTTRVKPNVSNVTGTKALNPSAAQKFDPQVKVKPETRVLETVDVNRGSFKGSDRRFEALREQAQRGVPEEAANARRILQNQGADVNVRPKTPAIPKGVTNSADDIVGAATDIAQTGKKSGLRFLIPGASAITAGLSIISGDYAGAIVDSADAAGDLAVATGATGAAATVGSALSAGAAVIGAGITSSYVGEWTRGVGDWVRGDGNNAALNIISSITEGLSAALETIGAPFRAIFEFVNSGFNMEKSNEVMAEIDSNIRESARQGLNAIDFLNIIPDEKGAYGTLGLYGDAAKRADAKMRGEGEVKNAKGGSYFLDNPSNFGPFQGGEAGGEVVTFTPFGGRKLVNEMGAHMTDALQAPFQFAIGGIAAAVDKVIGMLGPIGQMMKSAVGPTLEKLVKASGLTNLSLKNVSGGLGPMGGLFGGLTSAVSGLLPGLNLNRNTLNRGPGGAPRPGSTAGSNVLNVGSGGGELKGLTREDYEYMARTIAGEAGPGDDQYLVAGAILNRVASGAFPNSVKSVVTAGQGTAHPQFEGYIANANTDEIVARLMSPEGQARLVASLNRLQGRTDFKGQTQLHNRVAAEDPMFDTKGNFAHYSWQKGPNSVRPSNYVDPNYGMFIKKQNNLSPVTAPPTLGSNFPNINAPTLSTTDQILMETMPELFRAMQSLKSLNNGGGNTTTTDGTGGILQPASDPHASLFAPLHLSRLGAN